MKTSKPFAFVLWVDDEQLPQYLRNVFEPMDGFSFMHWIKHKAEKEPPSLLKRVKRSKPKPHFHCVMSWKKPLDYPSVIDPRVRLWAATHNGFGDCPWTYDRTHEGKVLNMSTWLAYVVHNPDYMAFCERNLDKPETHKHVYKWDNIKSTDDSILDRQITNAAAYISQCAEKMNRVEQAKRLGSDGASSLAEKLLECKDYSQMLMVKAIHNAAYYEQ